MTNLKPYCIGRSPSQTLAMRTTDALFIVSASFEGTLLRFGLVLFASMTRLPYGWSPADRTSHVKKPLNDSSKPLPDSIFRPVAAHGVTQMPASSINQGLRCNLR